VQIDWPDPVFINAGNAGGGCVEAAWGAEDATLGNRDFTWTVSSPDWSWIGGTERDLVGPGPGGYPYQFVQSLVASSVKRNEENDGTFSDKIDRIVANRYLGVPIFLFIMYLMFNIVQNVSAPFLDWIDGFFTIYLAGWVNDLLTALHAPVWLNSLLVDGVIAGVGGVLVFVP
ncbi:MAG: hypothetical protein ACK2T7_00695, partial [Anaerolineales bacterium]